MPTPETAITRDPCNECGHARAVHVEQGHCAVLTCRCQVWVPTFASVSSPVPQEPEATPDPDTFGMQDLPQPTGARKYDEGKLEHHLLPVRAVNEVVRVLMHGKEKYSEDNWREGGFTYTRLWDAAKRHMDDSLEGDDIDPDTATWGCHHLAEAVCNLLFIIELQMDGMLVDDRRHTPDN
jgi:Domain of unknown function (DUF5664)